MSILGKNKKQDPAANAAGDGEKDLVAELEAGDQRVLDEDDFVYAPKLADAGYKVGDTIGVEKPDTDDATSDDDADDDVETDDDDQPDVESTPVMNTEPEVEPAKAGETICTNNVMLGKDSILAGQVITKDQVKSLEDAGLGDYVATA